MRGVVRTRQALLAVAVGAGLLMTLAGCGLSSAGTSSNGGAATPTVTTGAAATAVASALTGCPAATQSVNWPTPPSATLGITSVSQATSVAVGQVVEVSLPWGEKWLLLSGAGTPALQVQQPAGYGDPTSRHCIWRFLAQRSGGGALTFSEQPLCANPRSPCPQYIRTFSLTVVVHA